MDNSSINNNSEDEDEDRMAPVPAATISGASGSATTAAETTSDECSTWHVAPCAGFALFIVRPNIDQRAAELANLAAARRNN